MEKYGNMKKTKIYFIRHGQSIGNLQMRFLGWTDLDLTELGYAQAKATADKLSDVHFDAVYSSSLIRAYNTAKPHADQRNLDVISSDNLRESFCGDWENMICSDIEKQYGELYTIDWPKKFGIFAFPGGESIVDAGSRFYAEVLELARKNLGGTILVVSHAAVIRMFWAMISRIAPEEVAEKIPFATNASFSVAEYDGENFTPLLYSEDDHLSTVGITKISF